LAGSAASDPGKDTQGTVRWIKDCIGGSKGHPREFQGAGHDSAFGVPDGRVYHGRVVGARAVVRDHARSFVQRPMCHQRCILYRLSNVLGQNNQVLQTNGTVAPGHRADIAQRFVRTPTVNHDTEVCTVDNSVPVKINDWAD
jgi:hypothetical protein